MQVLQRVRQQYKIDESRIYLMGHSMGGIGTWKIAPKFPDIWAALAPIAGNGAPDTLEKIRHIPQIIVHGDADPTVPVSGSRNMVAKLKELGAEHKYIEVPGGLHSDVVAPNLAAIVEFFNAHKKSVKSGVAALAGNQQRSSVTTERRWTMFKKCLAGFALAAVLVWTASAQDAKAVIGDASKAMGVDTLKTVQYSATGFDFALGQAPNPGSPWPKFINKSYTRAINFETPASRVDRVRVQGENPPRGGGQQPIVGEQPQNQTIIVNADTPWVQQLEIWMMPHGFLRAAATRNATVEARTVGGKKYNVVTFVGDNKAKVNGYINEQNLVERVETWIDNPFLGDMLFEAIYSDYKDAGGAQFPMHIVQKQGGYPIFDLNVTDVKVNAAVNIQPPQGRGGAPAAAARAASGRRSQRSSATAST